MKLDWGRSSDGVRRIAIWAFALACLGLIIWGVVASWQRPCRQALEVVSPGGVSCPSLLEDLAPLGVALGLWAMAAWVIRTRRMVLSAYFVMIAGVLATGKLSALESDLGSRLFYVLLAWASPTVCCLHYDLLSRPPGRLGQIILGLSSGLAIVLSLPFLLWTRAALESMAWAALWRNGVRLTLVLGVLASILLIVWHVRHDWAEARRRPVRLVAFGNIVALLPLLLLSLLPSVLGLAIKVPWEISFLGLLLSPLFYVYALMPARLEEIGAALKHVCVYYIVGVLFSCVFLVGVALFRDFPASQGQAWLLVGVPFGLISGGAIVFLPRALERLTDWVWFGDGLGYNHLVKHFTETLAVTLDRDALQRLLVRDLAQAMRLSWSALFLRDRNRAMMLVASTGLGEESLSNVLPEDGRLASYLAGAGKPVPHSLVRAALAGAVLSEAERSMVSLSHVALWLPLASGGVLYGVLLIGPKSGDDVFMLEDQRALDLLSYQAGITAHNVRLGEEKAAIEAQLLQSQKMEAIGRLAAGIAHDFNNILTGIIGFAALLQMREDLPEDALADLKLVKEGGERAARLVRQILDFSRKSIIQRQSLDLLLFLKETTKFLKRTIRENIQVIWEAEPGDYLVQSDPSMMQQVLTNLAVNASDAMPEGGELRIRLAHFAPQAGALLPFPDMRAGAWIILSVSDTGAGIPSEVLPYIYEPFFTTKGVGQGSGLGLAQVYGIVQQHEGYIDVRTAEGKGTTFSIYLPALPIPEQSSDAAVLSEVLKGHGEMILVVEDEETVLDAIKRLLEHASYRVLAATDAQEALRIYAQHGQEVALVLTDMIMPGMKGWELIQELRARNPAVKAIILSGYPLEEEGRKVMAQGVMAWIQKPVDAVQLAQAVSRALC